MPLLKVSDLRVHYPTPHGVVRAVDGVNLEVAERETVALVGESGCGKSTLARAVLGLEHLQSGQIALRERVIHQAGSSQRALGLGRRELSAELQMVFQNPDASLNPRMTLASALAEPFKIHDKVQKAGLDDAVCDLLTQVGIDPSLRNRYPHELSGGQRQRVSIARALAVGPKLLVLDEAVSGLDVSIRAQILNLLVSLKERLNLAYLFITHDLGVARHTADRIYVMYLGQVVEVGNAAAILTEPANPYTKALVSAVPSIDPERQREAIVLQGEVPSPINPPQGCRFHPRCPQVFDRCAKEVPQLYRLAQRRARCLLYESNDS
ncbi:MAG TPA: ABC transporter ATP-binding protein [Polyangiaceae bacterium]|nr:ABC transporter ATP-binding protein [Polyangiaceae bacterium]